MDCEVHIKENKVKCFSDSNYAKIIMPIITRENTSVIYNNKNNYHHNFIKPSCYA